MSSSRPAIFSSLDVVIKSSNSEMSLRSKVSQYDEVYNPYMGMGIDRANVVQNVHVCKNIYLGFW